MGHSITVINIPNYYVVLFEMHFFTLKNKHGGHNHLISSIINENLRDQENRQYKQD